MEYNKQEIMERFAKERKRYCTQETLANAIGISPKTVSAYECGRKNPSLEIFIKMCIVINADIEYIIYGKNKKLNMED